MSVAITGQPVMARDASAPVILAQQDKDKDQGKNKNQNKDNRGQGREQGGKGEERREQRQDLRQEQPRQKSDTPDREKQGRDRQDRDTKDRDTQKGEKRDRDKQNREQKSEQQRDRPEQQQRQEPERAQQRRDAPPRQQPERKDDNRDDRDTRDTKPERRDRPDAKSQPQQERRDDRARKLDDVRGERRERRDGNRTVIEEGNRTIIRDGDRTIIRHDETERFRRAGRDVNVQRVGSETRTVVVGPNGQRVVTVTDPNGRLLRRSRFVDGREVIIIDNRPRGGRRADAFFVVGLPALAIASLAIPRDRYIVDAEGAPPEYIYGALMAPPVEPLPRAYTLDEIRYSPEVRNRMPRIDLDTVTFDLGSWDVLPAQYDRLAPIAEGIRRAIAKNPNEVFLIEGHTDATGNDDDNLSLSDRRAEAVSVILTDQFQIPPENLTTQGYGEQQLKVPTEAAERANRRVTVRRITPLLQQGEAAAGPR